MLHFAFVEARALGWQGKAGQVADLADAFHNLPNQIFGVGPWSVALVREMLQHYQSKYEGQTIYNYVSMLDEIFPPEAS